MNDGTAFQKRRKLLSMLDEGLVMVHLDPRPDAVVVPGWLKDSPVLRLNLAYGYRLPALDIGADGIYAVLSFNKQNFGCTLPWSAIFAVTFPDKGHEGTVWPESLPPELAAEANAMGGGAADSEGHGVSLAREDDEAGDGPSSPEHEPAPPEPAPADEAKPDIGPRSAPRARPAPAAAAARDEPRPPAPPLFKVHEGGAGPSRPADVEPSPGDDAPPGGAERKRSHLKLVKG